MFAFEACPWFAKSVELWGAPSSGMDGIHQKYRNKQRTFSRELHGSVTDEYIFNWGVRIYIFYYNVLRVVGWKSWERHGQEFFVLNWLIFWLKMLKKQPEPKQWAWWVDSIAIHSFTTCWWKWMIVRTLNVPKKLFTTLLLLTN